MHVTQKWKVTASADLVHQFPMKFVNTCIMRSEVKFSRFCNALAENPTYLMAFLVIFSVLFNGFY